MGRKSILLLCIGLFMLSFISYPSKASNSVISEFQPLIEVNPYMSLFTDESGEMSLEDILQVEISEQFDYTGDAIPSYGYTNNTSYWVSFSINPIEFDDRSLLQLDNPTMDRVWLYKPLEDGSYQEIVSGDLLPYETRPINNRVFVFHLDLSGDEIKTYYMKLQSEGAMQIPLRLMAEERFITYSQLDYLILGLLAGLTAVMGLYNLFLYFSLRHKSYLYYVVFIAVNLMTFMAFSGLAYQFFWPELTWWNNRSIVFFIAATNLFAVIFANSFLEIPQRLPRANKFYYITVASNLVIIAILLFSYPLALNLVLIGTIMTLSFNITVAYISKNNGFVPARFFLLAWYVFIIGVLISIFTDLGFIPFTFITKYAWQITSIVELLLLSFALADKINSMRKEKEELEFDRQKNQLERLKTLERVDRLKDDFLTVTSHELRTPLAGIIGIAESLYDGAAGETSPLMRKNLSMIIVSGRRLSQLVNDITDFSKMKNNEIELFRSKVDLVELTSLVVAISETLIGDKEITIINKLSPSLPLVFADENRTQQILYNLLHNAIKYTESGTITLTSSEKEGCVYIHIEDTGQGISKDDLTRIFLPYETGSMETNGLGIGLSVTKRLLSMQQGKLEVESTLEVGTTFTFALPVYKTQSQVSQAVPVSKKELPIVSDYFLMQDEGRKSDRGRKILIADDEPINIQVLRNYLTLEGYEVIAVNNGIEVLEVLHERKDIDLVILDVMMPKLSGLRVCHEIRKSYSITELPIILLTAKNHSEDRIDAFEIGANDYIVKPFDRRELLARTATHLSLKESVKELTIKANELTEVNDRLEEKVFERTVEIQEINQQLRKKNKELMEIESSRMQLLSNISHELGTPITFLQGYLQMVREGIIDYNDHHYLELVQQKIKLLDRLIYDLFDLVKFESGRMSMDIELVNVEEWIESIQLVIEGETEHTSCDFYFLGNKGDIPAKEAELSIDMERMNQVIVNLVSNAIKHTDERGLLTFSITVNESGEELGFNGELILEIRDNGAGIEADKLPYIFERFFKSSSVNSSGGTGLGLAITKQIVDYHKGSIWVESELGVGTVFYIRLPLYISTLAQPISEEGTYG
ncbi:response regulator [Paenalkalicoccus suaedae]|uniref:histidine kinase n=1 Tax=Paenalkalicoccus suaedae TaxID=2592382 RepID=A0A859FAU0_9BACI|nr:ATP-binding protein [Paenalkalicoccus suaedae]QKS70369.1 response regulator [Paenalkalicoccus suaedae]